MAFIAVLRQTRAQGLGMLERTRVKGERRESDASFLAKSTSSCSTLKEMFPPASSATIVNGHPAKLQMQALITQTTTCLCCCFVEVAFQEKLNEQLWGTYYFNL